MVEGLRENIKRAKKIAAPVLISAAALLSLSTVACKGRTVEININNAPIPSAATATPRPTPTETPRPTPTATPERSCQEANTNREAVVISGVPSLVDRNQIDIARGQFVNTIGGGSEAFIAEPGGLYNINEVLTHACPAFQNIPEGGFAALSAGQARIKIGEIVVTLPPKVNNNYIFIVRGLYGDNKQNTDRNTTMTIDGYVPGHAMVYTIPAQANTNTGFASEGQILQMVTTSHNGGTNCGDGGCSNVTLVGLDLNTGAFTILEQTRDRSQNVQTGWTLVATNEQYPRPTQ